MTNAPTRRSELKRLPERGTHDRPTIDAILDDGMLCHLGFISDGGPVVIPTLYARRGDEVLIHGSSASRMLRGLASGLEVCLTVSHIDGIVLARSAFHHSINYRSVVLFGIAEELVDLDERAEALDYITDSLVPGRIAQLRPTTEQEVRGTKVLVLPITEASAKVRSGPPGDDPEDEDPALWAGVIPVSRTAGTPQPDAITDVLTSVPDHVVEWTAR
ncbi:MAG TPA: pyridoxamine 5'-phosphate oxidase family protein [Actinobacteria bacterium]|nr:pyridoxamine 5'-phosphate oxidase [bacterium BMS3Bbin02]HDL41492.1 pyridoxamine 5'-phosphate oxidase family protein [Actinomycetota bacterium]